MECSPDAYYCDNGECFSTLDVLKCDGIPQCPDGSDELSCSNRGRPIPNDQRYQPPEGFDVALTIVFPTIFACIFLVIAMLFGIKKCRQWEMDRLGEMRRTRRLIQRLTAGLREKNFRTLQGLAAQNLRKRQALAAACVQPHVGRCEEVGRSGGGSSGGASGSGTDPLLSGRCPPPHYDAQPPFQCGTSPPPTYEDTILENFYMQIMGGPRSQRSSTSSRRSLRRSIF